MRLILAEPFKSLWAGRDPFEAVEALDVGLESLTARPGSGAADGIGRLDQNRDW